jgi:hypothetical protein
MHMCDELAAFGRQATCMHSQIGRRTNGSVRHTCQHGSAVVETISQSSSSLHSWCRPIVFGGRSPIRLANRQGCQHGPALCTAQMRKLLKFSEALPRPRCHGEQLAPDYRTIPCLSVSTLCEGGEQNSRSPSACSLACPRGLISGRLQRALNRTSDDA